MDEYHKKHLKRWREQREDDESSKADVGPNFVRFALGIADDGPSSASLAPSNADLVRQLAETCQPASRAETLALFAL